MRIDIKDGLGGVFFIAAGLFVSVYSYAYLNIGVAVRMGPGYFPFLLGLLLVALGVAIAVGSLFRRLGPIGTIPWRAIGPIAAAPAVFAFTVEGLGLLAATAITCLVASYASPGVTLRQRLLMTLVLTGICMLVFVAGLRISVPLFGTWFGE